MTRIRYCFIRMTSVVNGITDCFRTKCWHVLVFCRVLVFEVNKILKNNLIDIKIKMYEGTVEIFSLFYSRSETQDKRPLGREQDRSWCKAFFVPAHSSMDIGGSLQVCCRSVHGSMGCNQESFTLVWWWHHFRSGFLSNGHVPTFTSFVG